MHFGVIVSTKFVQTIQKHNAYGPLKWADYKSVREFFLAGTCIAKKNFKILLKTGPL